MSSRLKLLFLAQGQVAILTCNRGWFSNSRVIRIGALIGAQVMITILHYGFDDICPTIIIWFHSSLEQICARESRDRGRSTSLTARIGFAELDSLNWIRKVRDQLARFSRTLAGIYPLHRRPLGFLNNLSRSGQQRSRRKRERGI